LKIIKTCQKTQGKKEKRILNNKKLARKYSTCSRKGSQSFKLPAIFSLNRFVIKLRRMNIQGLEIEFSSP